MCSWENDASKANNLESVVTEALIITDLSAENGKASSLSLVQVLLHKQNGTCHGGINHS